MSPERLRLLTSGSRVDVFVLKTSAIAQHELRRAREEVIEPGTRPFYFATPEDIILNKLSRWKMEEARQHDNGVILWK